MKLYIAGKVSKSSHFDTHSWRDNFVTELKQLSGLNLINLDPTKSEFDQANPELVVGGANTDFLVMRSSYQRM